MSGYEALRSDAAWVDLSARGKIRVTGEDRARLLHAMSTNNIQELATGEGVYAFFLTAQGRIVADTYIYNLGESLFLDTEPETAHKVYEHLDKYIIADDAAVEEETEQWSAIGVEGPEIHETAQALSIALPQKRYSTLEWGAGFVARVGSTGAEGVRIFVPRGQQQALVQRLTATGVPNATAEETRTVRLENGIPRYGEDITERNLVHETQQLHAVHTNKGCYLGQEIVERVRSRGQVHRLLTSIRIRGTAVPPAGSKLETCGKEIAEITSAAYSPALGEVVALAYVRTKAAQSKAAMTLMGSNPPIAAYIP